MANADNMKKNASWACGALNLTSQTVCPLPTGNAGFWNDSGTVKYRDEDGNDSNMPIGTVAYAPVDAVSVSNIAGTYSSAAKTFTVTATGALTVDGVTASLGKRILLQTQTTASQQGIYIVTTAGDTGISPVLTRADDNDVSSAFVNGAIVSAKSGGSTYGSTLWELGFSGAFTLDTTTPAFSQTVSSVTWANIVSAATNANSTLSLKKETNQTINVATSTTATAAGGNLTITAATGATSGTGGTLALAGGAGGNAGDGGTATLTAGAAGGATKTGGAVSVTGGAGLTTGAGGAVSATGGAGGNDAVGGAASVVGGAAGGGNRAGGAASVVGGAGAGSAAGGAVAATGGAGGATGAGGAITVTGGAGGATSGTGGAVTVSGGAGTNGNANGGALTLNGGAKNGSGADGAVSIAAVGSSLAIGNSGAIATWASKQAAGAATNTIADPGNAGAIPVTADGVCMLTSAGAETRTLALPAYVGQRIALMTTVYVGDIVITVAARINQATNTIITMGAVGDFIELLGVTIGGSLRWQVVATDGAALS